jgi:prolyl 4-hydroxylase
MRYEIIPDFLSAEECNQLITSAKARLATSYTWDVATGSSQINDYRQSEQMFFNKRENGLISTIENRLAGLTGYPIENGEGLQVVMYRNGGYYKPHWDYFSPEYEGNKGVIARGGQRVVTVLMYLNDVYNNPLNKTQEGGETYFPRMELMVKPKTGKALYWHNMKDDGVTVDETTYHEGRPVPVGCVKWIMTLWIRAGTFR